MIFIPTDLQFFIQFELDDRERRRAADGRVSQRQVPSPEVYKRYQVDNGIIATDAIGGQYLPVVVKRYLLRNTPEVDIQNILSKPKEWHGAPLACLRRCIYFLGSARVSLLDKDIRLKLERLRELYFFDEEDPSSPHNPLPHLAAQTGPHDRKGKRPLDDTMLNDSQPTKKQRDSRQGDSGSSRYSQGATTFCPVLQREVRACWSLGPEVSTEEAVRQFAPVITRSRDYPHV